MVVIRQGQTYAVRVMDGGEAVSSASVSLRQGVETRTYAGTVSGDGSVYVALSQEDTLDMKQGPFEIQAKAKTADGRVKVSPILAGVVLEGIGKDVLR